MNHIFYHLFVPVTPRGIHWNIIFDEQMRLVKESGLMNNLESFSLVLVAPYYTQLDNYKFEVDGKNVSWADHIVNYISLRYPFINIVDLNDSGSAIDFEAPTLFHLWDRAYYADGNFLYIHSKGISHKNPNPAIDNWRDLLNHCMLTNWVSCTEELEWHDVVAVRDKHTANVGDILVSGNFFWAQSSYLRTLPDPRDTSKYCTDPAHLPGMPLYRLGLEKWIMSANPKTHWIADTGIDHYKEYCVF